MLVEQYGDQLYRFIRYIVGDTGDADDLVQEVFLRVIQSWHRFNHKSNPKTWLWSIAKNCIREYFRTQKRSPSISGLNEAVLKDPAGETVVDEMMLSEALRHLPVSQREVFVERIVNERSTSDTALLLGWSEAKVRTTLHRAVHAIRKFYREGDDVSERA